MAEKPEQHKICRYSHLDSSYMFTHMACETSGVFGLQSLKFIKDLGRNLKIAMDEVNWKQYLLQRISVAIQTGNTASILETLGQQEGLFWPSPMFLYLFIDIFVVVLLLHYNLLLFNICKVICYFRFSSLFSVFSFGSSLYFSVILFMSPVLVCDVLPSFVSTFSVFTWNKSTKKL